MELISVTIGSWFPRTKLHLKEYFEFLRDGRAHPALDEQEIKQMRKDLNPRNVSYVGGRFDLVSADFDGIDCAYHEDGLLSITVQANDVAEDIKRLDAFYEGKLTPALALLFGLGTPVMTYSLPETISRPVIVLAREVDDVSARKFIAEQGDEVHYIARHTERTVYYSKRIILIGDESGGAGTTRYLITNLILSREYEHRLRRYLELHRSMWDSIAVIQQRSSIPATELPQIRDSLLNFRRDMAIIRARISQMSSYLAERQNEVDDLGLTEDLRAVEAYRYSKLVSATTYITRLWDMIEEYLESTVEITGFLYQENLQKEIGIQQFIFLVGAVAGVLGLGTIAETFFTIRGEDGLTALTGSFSSFNPFALVRFGGIALLASVVFFFGIRPSISLFRRISPATLVGRYKRTHDRKEKEEEDEE
ncbi:hypothetical protein ACFL26_00375 [Patescibacteria group bacterium]